MLKLPTAGQIAVSKQWPQIPGEPQKTQKCDLTCLTLSDLPGHAAWPDLTPFIPHNML